MRVVLKPAKFRRERESSRGPLYTGSIFTYFSLGEISFLRHVQIQPPLMALLAMRAIEKSPPSEEAIVTREKLSGCVL